MDVIPGSDKYPDLVVPAEKIQKIEGIVSERNRIQDLLGKAEAGKDRVKPEIYQKVVSDYEAKLADVAAQYEPAREAVGADLKAISDKETGLRGELGRVNDQLEELRFRCAVGEFSEEELAQKEQEKASLVAEYNEKLQVVDACYAQCKQFLSEDDFQEAIEPAGAPTPSEDEIIHVEDAPELMPAESGDEEIALTHEGSDPGELEVQADALVEPPPPPPPDAPEPVPAPPPPPPAPEPAIPDEMMAGDPELTLSEPIPMPVDDAGPSTLDGAEGPGDVEATITFQKRSFINVIKDDGAQDTYLLGVEPLSIGRNHRNDIVLLDRSISRKHAEVKKEGDGYVIMDMSSGGGLFVNGEKNKRTVMKNGDEISIGDFRLVYKEEMGY